MVGDLFLLIAWLVAELWAHAFRLFLGAVAVGLVLAALAWWGTTAIALNFNRQFTLRPRHHVYAAFAAFVTLVFTVLFVSLRYSDDVADLVVSKWQINIRSDRRWADDTFREAYEAVYSLRAASGERLEDFSAHPHPDTTSSTRIPTTHERSKQVAARAYAEAAVQHFHDEHPLLSTIIWARSTVAEAAIVEDMRHFFANRGDTYPVSEAIELAGRHIRDDLRRQVPRIVLISRILLIVAFLIIQAITLALLVRAALADIKENRTSQRNRRTLT